MSAGRFSRRRELLSYRATFAAEWAKYLRARYDSPEEVAVAFAVEASTARKWMEGSHAPSGFAVALAFILSPDLATSLLGGAKE